MTLAGHQPAVGEAERTTLTAPGSHLSSDHVTSSVIAEIDVNPELMSVYAEGWQSWSPSLVFRYNQASPRPDSTRLRDHFYRSGGTEPPAGCRWQADGGLLAVDPASDGRVHIFAARDASRIPVVRAAPRGGAVTVSANGPCEHLVLDGPLGAALREWAVSWQAGQGITPRPAPSGWCTWYGHRRKISEEVITANMDAMDRHGLPVDVVQVDDGWQQAIGDWTPAPGFPAIARLADLARQRGRTLGLWFTPFIADVRAQVVADHPDWWVRDAAAPFGSRRTVKILDVTHPAAAGYLTSLVAGWTQAGVGYLKADFAWGGAVGGTRYQPDIDGTGAYRLGLRLLRQAAGDAYLLGCGTPLLASAGAGLDAMRVSPDTGPNWLPPQGDLSQPSGLAAVETGRARGFLHSTWFRADLDCILAHPQTEHREELARHIASLPGGLRISGDRLPELDDWGIRATRQLLRQEWDEHGRPGPQRQGERRRHGSTSGDRRLPER